MLMVTLLLKQLMKLNTNLSLVKKINLLSLETETIVDLKTEDLTKTSLTELMYQ